MLSLPNCFVMVALVIASDAFYLSFYILADQIESRQTFGRLKHMKLPKLVCQQTLADFLAALNCVALPRRNYVTPWRNGLEVNKRT